ncbi:MAG: hypothetical protein Q9217_006423 [Psora testacea]
MFPVSLPDWKKIGKNVGKKLRDILNPPADTAPSREERRAQRLLDVFKGFAYFDDFTEVKNWKKEDVDPIQCANTPLLPRPASGVEGQTGPKANVLLCHDYNGGYHDYEAIRPSPLQERLYFCNYLQYVETFVYFSHKLVSCPPPTWINTLHRNGIKVLGTFIIEPQTPNVERMLDEVDGEYVVARRLADMAETYGFDGWLLNIEREFPSFIVDVRGKMVAFIHNLKHALGSKGKVVWYDALTKHNEVEYQNSLNLQNIDFALAANDMFTNYKWAKTELNNARITAQWHGFDTRKIYFGIDVWAQNTNVPGVKRITYPEEGGGGTLTGLAVKTLAEHGFSAAVFGPAWTYEHFPISDTNGNIADSVDKAMWEGNTLPEELGCDCKDGRPHHRPEYQSFPIVQGAHEFAAGSSCFLESDFQAPFGTANLQMELLSELANRSPWRGDGCPSSQGESYLRTYLKVTDALGPNVHPSPTPKRVLRLKLFNLNISATNALTSSIRCRRVQASKSIGSAGFYTAYRVPSRSGLAYTEIMRPIAEEDLEYNIPIQSPFPGDCIDEVGIGYLAEVGVFCVPVTETPPVPSIDILHIYNFVIRPLSQSAIVATIDNIRVIERQSGLNLEKRLTWNWTCPEDHCCEGRPWSKTTGPFSQFDILLDGRRIGDAFCLEFPLGIVDFDEVEESDEAQVTVRGNLFGGGIVVSEARLSKTDFIVTEATETECSSG